MKSPINKSGFTLLELLVVIAVVGILTSFTVSFLGDGKIKAQNATTIRHVGELKKAIDQYEIGNNSFPSSLTSGCSENFQACVGIYSDGLCGKSNDTCLNSDLSTELAPYINIDKISPYSPDPAGNEGIIYEAIQGGQGYVIKFFLHNESSCGNAYLLSTESDGVWCQDSRIAYDYINHDGLSSETSCGFVGTSNYELFDIPTGCRNIHVQSNGGADIINMNAALQDSVRGVGTIVNIDSTIYIRVGYPTDVQHVSVPGIHYITFTPLSDAIVIVTDEFDPSVQIIP